MKELTVQAREIVPFGFKQVGVTGTELAKIVAWAAEQQIREEVPDFEEQYTGAQREAMIGGRAAEILENMASSFDYARAYVHEEFLRTGAYHPNLMGDTQEFLDEICSQATQKRSGQVKYLVDVIVPKAQQYGINVEQWMRDTTPYKCCEVVPVWREVINDKNYTDEEKRDFFIELVGLSTQSINAIRAALLTSGPREFEIHRNEAGDGFEWYIPAMTSDTNAWMARQVQPYGRFSDNGQDPEEKEVPENLKKIQEIAGEQKLPWEMSRGKREDRRRFKSRSRM